MGISKYYQQTQEPLPERTRK